ncbi:Ulp1 family isopeptidase [Sinorhizobium sp. 8-89]|uniref:Ulp1 family isopeptidase n=1 Tax=Sinorhizobium sp. 8-89 TaxID=3049089 RepID=UPI0024C408F4|nr:Ulp1 family isopeptidase [Sinorhizobium sp. 8-89]
MPEDQAGFEQQVSGLQLSSAGERSGDAIYPGASMPNTRPAEVHGNIQRADIEESTWMPSQSDPRNSGFSSTSHTVPSEAHPAARTKDSKGRHLSRVKSGVVKAFGGSCRENSAGVSASQVVHSELRICCAKRRIATEPFASDKILVSRFLRASLGSTFLHPAQRNASHLRQFSAWLNEREREPIADRLNEHKLDDDAREYAQQSDPTGSKSTKDQIIEALENLRHADLPPAELTDDERLIAEFRKAAQSAGRPKSTVLWWVGRLQQLRIWLWSEGLTLTSVLDRPEELKRLATLSGTRSIHAALPVLQEFHAANVEERPANFNIHGRQRFGRQLNPHPADARLIDAMLKEALRGLGDSTAAQKLPLRLSASRLRAFSDWLQREGKGNIVDRLSGTGQRNALNADAKNFRRNRRSFCEKDLTMLRQYLQVVEANRALGLRAPEEARSFAGEDAQQSSLFQESSSAPDTPFEGAWDWLSREMQGSASQSSAEPSSPPDTPFEGAWDWLSRQMQGPARPSSSRSRSSDLATLSGTRSIHAALPVLQEFHAANVEERPANFNIHGRQRFGRQLNPHPADARLIDAMLKEALRGLGDSTAAQKLPLRLSASRLRAFSDWLQREGKGNIVDRLSGTGQRNALNADAKNFRRNRRSFCEKDLTMLRQYLQVVEANRALGLRAPEEARSFAGEDARQSSLFQESSSAPDTPFEGAWDWLSRQMQGPARPSSSRSRSSDIYRSLDSLVDLPSTPHELRDDHYAPAFPSTSSDAQIAALSPTASSHDGGRLELGATDWLGDQHIAADYALLMQELQRDNPDLASRTRLVDPLIAHYHLRLGPENEAVRAFQRIVHNQDGNDTADFLFLPVSDASAWDPECRGWHWSLLLVDRRERARPVAFHYDSNRGSNNELATMLAQRLGARLEPARMTQQRNGYDCGVFVLDGTRVLVRQLAQERRPAMLHLDNLVVDRLALQDRLRR